jgi:hypothetical protein
MYKLVSIWCSTKLMSFDNVHVINKNAGNVHRLLVRESLRCIKDERRHSTTLVLLPMKSK